MWKEKCSGSFNGIKPKGFIGGTIEFNAEEICLKWKSDLVNIESAYLMAYDNFNDIPYSVWNIDCARLINCSELQDLAAEVLETDKSRVVRLCLIIQTDTEIFCHYLKTENVFDENTYVQQDAMIAPLCEIKGHYGILYYSRGGVFSIEKFNNDYQIDILTPKLCAFSLEKNIVTMQISVPIFLAGDTVYIEMSDGESYQQIIPGTVCSGKNTVLRNLYEFSCDFCELSKHTKSICRIGLISNSNRYIVHFGNVDTGVFDLFIDNVPRYLKVIDNKEYGATILVAEHFNKYMVSIVMAVYNTALFVGEAIDSLLEQNTERLENHIHSEAYISQNNTIYENIWQLILVDDGSTDGSGGICDQYVNKNTNIQVIHKENEGVCIARNMGIRYAEGKYINFMDSDDKFSDSVIDNCIFFLENNIEETDMVTFPTMYFDRKSGAHWMNSIFSNGTRVIDLFKEWTSSVYMVNRSFFKTNLVKGQIAFDEALKIGEDYRFIYDYLISGKAKIGVVDNCIYWYRVRSEGEPSAMEKGASTEFYYLPFLRDANKKILEKAKREYGFVPKYIQYAVLGQLQWRFKEDTLGEKAESVIGLLQFQQYKSELLSLMTDFDYDVIMSLQKVWIEHKFYMLRKANQSEPDRVVVKDDVKYFFNNEFVTDASAIYCKIEILEINNGILHLEGQNCALEAGGKTCILLNEKHYPAIELKRDERHGYSLGDVCLYHQSFACDIPLPTDEEICELRIGMILQGDFVEKKSLRLGKFVPLSDKWKQSYYTHENWAIKKIPNGLVFYNIYQSRNLPDFEQEFQTEIESSKEYKSSEDLKAALVLRRKVLAQKQLSYKALSTKGTNEKKIWILSDRVNLAGDNGEALFMYLVKHIPQNVELYFAINKDCADYWRLKQYGNVVDHASEQYRYLYLLSDCIISSQIDEYVINPFAPREMKKTELFKDILHDIKCVFLQHGITKDDISNWVNKYNKNLKGLVTAANPEYQSMFDYPYYYTDKEIWLTGFPRYDRLYHNEKNYITIMPTWRKILSVLSEKDAGIRRVSNEFRDSEYYCFYNSLINNERLLQAADQYGFKICFMPHPTLWDDMDIFDHDERVSFFGYGKPYREVYAESKMVMTDYSSSVIDFTYLRKPVVYCQFDKEDFFNGEHAYVKGYFDYEKDGFGEVTYDLESLVDVIIDYMRNGCKLKKVYKKRIDQFFAYNDKNNCERVYKKLLMLNGLDNR